MLPIVSFPDGTTMNESLDIIRRLDKDNILKTELLDNVGLVTQMESILDKLGAEIHSLCMPYWIYSPEFSVSSRAYFQKKKEKKRGPFKALMQGRDEFLRRLDKQLEELEQTLCSYYLGAEFSIFDIMLASHMWGMYIFPEFQFSSKIHSYLVDVKKRCHFNYHEDFWA
jgi:glutaredoxin 2